MWRRSLVLSAGLAVLLAAPLALADCMPLNATAQGTISETRPLGDSPNPCTNPADCVAHGSSVPIKSGKR